jgi:hypothetical protein
MKMSESVSQLVPIYELHACKHDTPVCAHSGHGASELQSVADFSPNLMMPGQGAAHFEEAQTRP